MIKHDEIIGPSCLTRAADDEPLFVLRANDPLAPDLVRRWANKYFDSKKDAQSQITNAQRTKTRAALELANAMEAWKRDHP